MPAPEDSDDQLIKDLVNRPSMDSAKNLAVMQELRNRMEERAQLAASLQIQERDVRIRILEDRIAKLEAENNTKTAELRAVNRGASEERITRLVTERVDTATRALQNELATARHSITALMTKCDELTASKKKLREALDRAKEK